MNDDPKPPAFGKGKLPKSASRQAAWTARFSLKRSPYAVSEDLLHSNRI